MYEIVFLIIIFIIAALYSSVGHGGASGYLALMAIFGVEVFVMKSSALFLNIFVSGISWHSLYKTGNFKLKLALPFCLTSVPMAFVGSGVHVNSNFYKVVLGVFLTIAVFAILLRKTDIAFTKPINIYLALFFGAIIGFFSGMIGIGGGIILSPLILLFNWANIKETAAVSAIFIFLNSLSGIAGMYQNFPVITPQLIYMIVFALLGGYVGALYTKTKATPISLKYILSGVLLFAAIKLIILAK